MALLGKGKKKKKEEEADANDGAAEETEAPGEGGEGADEEGGEEEGGKKKSKKKLVIVAILGLVLIGGGVGGAYYAGLFGGESETAENEKEKDASQVVFYTMPQILVNLNASGKSTSFLKATVILELNSATDVLTVEANLPRLMDTFNTYLRELRSSDLAGSAGIQRLREELMLRTNRALEPMEINDVLFKEIVVQ